MPTAYLRLFIIPVMTAVFYLLASYIVLVALIEAIDPQLINIIEYFIPFNAIVPVALLETLPVFLISLLFTMQYTMTSITVKNIAYALTTGITMVVVKTALVILFVCIMDFFKQGDRFHALRSFSSTPLYFILIALLFIIVGLMSHYYFVWTKQAVNPIELKGGAMISSICYVLLVLCPPILSALFLAQSINDYYRSLYEPTYQTVPFLLLYMMGFVYSFILVLFWTYDIISKSFSPNTCATTTIKAYVFTQISYLILYMCLLCIAWILIALVFDHINLRYIMRNTMGFLIGGIAVIALVLLGVLASIVKNRYYKIYHIITCIIFIVALHMLHFQEGHYTAQSSISVIVTLFIVSLSLCFFALCIRGALKIAFK